jgi:hypothetical protein
MDVWLKIKARAAAMEAEAAKEISRAKAAAAKKKKEDQEALEMVLLIGGLILLIGLATWGGIYFYLHCNKYGCN